MYRTLAALIIALAFYGCSSRESKSLDDELASLRDATQTFSVAGDQGDTITGKYGTRIIVPPNSLVYSDGRAADGPVDIELIEAFDKSSMILNALSTESDGRLIETFGMIFLKATAGGVELVVNDASPIEVSIPNSLEGLNGQLFYGDTSGGNLNWEYAGGRRDTTEVVETTQQKGDLYEVNRLTYEIVDGARRLLSDTSYITEFEQTWDRTVVSLPRFFEFKINRLGWINCDRFINATDLTKIQIQLNSFTEPMCFVVFSDINSIMGVYLDENGLDLIEGVPIGQLVDVILIDRRGDELMWAKESITTGEVMSVGLKPKAISKEQLQAELKELD